MAKYLLSQTICSMCPCGAMQKKYIIRKTNKMRLFIYNIKHAFQNLKKNASYSLLTILGLTIGLTIFLSVSLFVFNENTVDQNIPNYQRIYRLYDVNENDCGLGYELADVIRQNYPNVESNCAIDRFEWPMLLRANNTYGNYSYYLDFDWYSGAGDPNLRLQNQRNRNQKSKRC